LDGASTRNTTLQGGGLNGGGHTLDNRSIEYARDNKIAGQFTR
jgi:hypothetical protein